MGDKADCKTGGQEAMNCQHCPAIGQVLRDEVCAGAPDLRVGRRLRFNEHLGLVPVGCVVQLVQLVDVSITPRAKKKP